jgi:hypothetical protein
MNNEPQFEGEVMKMPVSNTRADIDNEESTKSSGVVIFILFAVLAAILIGLYFWYENISKIEDMEPIPTRPTLETNKEPETVTATAETQSFGVMSTSDELSTIEADLESADFSNLEAELLQIDAELEAN